MVDQRAGLPVYERNRKKESPTGNQVAPIADHRAMPDTVCRRRSIDRNNRNAMLGRKLSPRIALRSMRATRLVPPSPAAAQTYSLSLPESGILKLQILPPCWL